MAQSASEIAEAVAQSEAQAEPREPSLKSEAAVDASPLGQPGEATNSLTSRPNDEIDADRIVELNLDATHSEPPSTSLTPLIAPPTTPTMAPGVGGFNIDPPMPRVSAVKSEVAFAHSLCQSLPNLKIVPRVPLQVQRMAVIVESGESSFLLKVLVIIAIASSILFAFREETRQQLSNILEAVTASYKVSSVEASKVSSVEVSAQQPRLVVESQKGLPNEPLPLGISLKDASGGEIVTVTGLAREAELSLGINQGLAGWLLSAGDLDKTFVGTPKDFVGVMDATVTLRSPRGELLDSQVVRFEWIQKKQEALMPALGPPELTPLLPPLEPGQIAALNKLGQEFLKRGDILSARLLFERAAIAGDAQAALELGWTFDVLTRSEALGIAADVAQARQW
jgi:hypothetical protein